jgi:hypothetical protein
MAYYKAVLVVLWRMAMPFTVKYKGSVDIECGSMDEAVELAQKLASMNGDASAAPVPRQPSRESGLEVSRYRELMGYLNTNQKRFLSLLIENPHGKTDRSLRQELGLNDNNALGGMMSGIAKSAKKAGVSVDSLWSSTWKRVGDEDVKEFRLNPEFRRIATEVGL